MQEKVDEWSKTTNLTKISREKDLQWLSRPSIKRNGHQQLELVGMYLSQLKHLYSSSGLIH